MSGRMRGVLFACCTLALLGPACSGKNTAAPPPSGIILLEDSFATFPGTNWSVSGSGIASFDGFAGNLAPCVSTTPGHTPGASVAIQSVAQFSAPNLTFSADMLLVEVGPGLGGGSIVVRDFAGGGAAASVTQDGQSGALTFRIGGTVSPPFGIIPGWHTYTFSYAAGTASWRFDGKVLYSVGGFQPPAAVVLSLENQSGSVFDFDNVLVTTP